MPLHTPHSVYFNRKPLLLCTNLGLVMLINQKGQGPWVCWPPPCHFLHTFLHIDAHFDMDDGSQLLHVSNNEDFCDEEGNFSIDSVWCTEPTMDVHSPLLQKMKLSWRKPPSTEMRATGRNDLGVKNTLKVCVTVFRNYWSLLLEYSWKLHWREHSSNTQGYEQDLKLVIFLVFVHFYVNSY